MRTILARAGLFSLGAAHIAFYLPAGTNGAAEAGKDTHRRLAFRGTRVLRRMLRRILRARWAHTARA
jgi:hypothetical protein